MTYIKHSIEKVTLSSKRHKSLHAEVVGEGGQRYVKHKPDTRWTGSRFELIDNLYSFILSKGMFKKNLEWVFPIDVYIT